MNVYVKKKNKKVNKESKTKEKLGEMELEGNQKLNRVRKLQFKKEKKQRNRQERAALQLANGLESFNLQGTPKEDYDFGADFNMK